MGNETRRFEISNFLNDFYNVIRDEKSGKRASAVYEYRCETVYVKRRQYISTNAKFSEAIKMYTFYVVLLTLKILDVNRRFFFFRTPLKREFYSN